MFDLFPTTECALIDSMSGPGVGRAQNERLWHRFIDLYRKPMIRFVELCGGGGDAEDIVQEVLVKLACALRAGKYRRLPNVKFRTYLTTLLRNELVTLFRTGERVRDRLMLAGECPDAASGDEPGEIVDAKWSAACRMAAVKDVMSQTAISPKAKAIYRAVVLDGAPVDEVCRKYGVGKSFVSQVKSRMNRRIEKVESLYTCCGLSCEL